MRSKPLIALANVALYSLRLYIMDIARQGNDINELQVSVYFQARLMRCGIALSWLTG